MAEIIQFPEPDPLGSCPKCHRNESILNVGRDHWAVCHRHKVRWLIGSNLFSSWRSQTDETWECNKRLLSTYRIVEPWFPPESYWENRAPAPEGLGDKEIPF